jgi:hypothetical protein
VLHDSHQRRLIINRCWLIYDLITKKFRPLHEFHIEFPSLVELALISGYLQVLVEITRRGHFLHIHEEYDFIEHILVVKVYSYNLLDKSKHSNIRADSLPHHRVDYKGHNLSHFSGPINPVNLVNSIKQFPLRHSPLAFLFVVSKIIQN